MDGVMGGGEGGGESERLLVLLIIGVLSSPLLTPLAVLPSVDVEVLEVSVGGMANKTIGVSSGSCWSCFSRRRSSAAARAAPGLTGVDSSMTVYKEAFLWKDAK